MSGYKLVLPAHSRKICVAPVNVPTVRTNILALIS